ncbi:unnamed protein product [Litomosoides sigmodontis]|uniref:Ribosome biogenesis protein BRX1 homolog n=1 Tax=Litomosoides sigmodontis TaxID=42156 RepID=A0A3P6SZD3_LITSI|nr:unnamed protein product [Litomosoides sigmodontis]
MDEHDFSKLILSGIRKEATQMSRRFRELETVDKLLTKRRRSVSATSESSDNSKESFGLLPKNKDIPEQVRSKWTNRERVLVFCSRGASYRMRHLMKDFLNLMPHSKSDNKLDKKKSLVLINEIAETFSTPYHHPRSKPFIDHVFTFSITPDAKIWFRNFQIVDETLELQEIGPRMVLEIIRIFDGSFEGSVLYDNPNYISPNTVRSEIKKKQSRKYEVKKLVEKARGIKLAEQAAVKIPDPVGEIFDTERMLIDPRAKEIKRIIENKRKKKSKNKTRGSQATS